MWKDKVEVENMCPRTGHEGIWVDVLLHKILTSALCPGRFTASTHWIWSWVGPQSRSERSGEEKRSTAGNGNMTPGFSATNIFHNRLCFSGF